MSFSKKIKILFLLIIFLSYSSITLTQAQSCASYTQQLTMGSTDDATQGEVSRLQSYLNSLGLLNVAPTGYFGSLTRTAVSRYQISKGITPYGMVGPLTRQALSQACFSLNSPLNTSPNVEMQNFAPINVDLACLESQYDFKVGSRDSALFGEIMKLQTFLFQNNLMSYPPTGYYGPLTLAGVSKYQSLRHIPITGKYDYPTRLTLAKETCQGVSHLTPPVVYNYSPLQNPTSTLNSN